MSENEVAPTAVAPVPPAEPATELVDIADFMRIKLRVGTILEAEAVPKSKKLLKLKVNIGEATPRQILAGIALHYDPATIVGRQIVVVANLKPAKLMGLESQGMLLAAGDGGEVLSVLLPDKQVPEGSTVR